MPQRVRHAGRRDSVVLVVRLDLDVAVGEEHKEQRVLRITAPVEERRQVGHAIQPVFDLYIRQRSLRFPMVVKDVNPIAEDGHVLFLRPALTGLEVPDRGL
jgi:hypothetical protein